MPTPCSAIAPPNLLRALPAPVRALCHRLECAGLAAWVQGETLLDAWLGPTRSRRPAHAILCRGTRAALLAAMPAAVVTAEEAQRSTQATAAGPVDLIATESRTVDETLLAFGLAPLAVAVRPSDGRWADPGGVREALAKRELTRLDPGSGRPDPFALAPRRYWLAALLIAEYGLEPSAALIASARAALPEVALRLPEGAPARRVLERILACPTPARALAFLRETGASEVILPDLDPNMERRIDALACLPALRWAAYLRGTSTARALARLRMPHALARRIGRLQELHPLDRNLSADRDGPLRRTLNRLTREELDGLIAWRRLELAPARAPDAETRTDEAIARERLARIERAIERLREQERASGSVRQLALSGGDVMRILATGAGPHVGRALAHLAHWVAEAPSRNTAPALEAALRAWQADAGERSA
ncbi:MAG: hypothetical protein R3F35_05280 [Myxococcota bacterium]